MASSMCQAYPTFYSDYNAKCLFVSENFYEKFIVTQDYCVSNHSSFCPVENCKLHLVLIESSLDQILQRLDKYHFTYQIVDCLYTLYKYRFYFNIISSRGEVFNQSNRAVEHNLNCRIPEKLPSVAKKRQLRKNSKDIISVLLRSLRPLRLLDQLFWKGFEKFKTQSMRLTC